MDLTPPQKEIARNAHRFRVLNCGRRFGKTTEAIEEIKGYALASNEGDKIAYIAPTYQQARDIAWEMLKKELKPIALKINESRLELEVKNKEGKPMTIVLRGWESIETLRGQKFRFVVIDEVASMRNFWVGWQEVLRPALTDLQGHCLFISTPKGFNHFYDLFNLQDTDTDYKSFHFTTYDNPFIPREELEKARKELTEDRFAQEYLADFRKTEGLVYKEFNREKHLFDDYTNRGQIIRRIVGVDFGFTNPSAIYTIELNSDNHYWITGEFYKTGKTNSELIDYIITIKADAVYPDPAEPDRIKEMQDRGLNVQEVSKDIEKGVDSVVQLFRTGRLHVHKDCISLISELETYRYPDKRPNNNEPETPIKENDHACDAIRYALFNSQPIVEDGDTNFSLYTTKFR